MPEIVFAVPGDLATPTGGYAYARHLIAALPAAGWTPRVISLPVSFPRPHPKDLAATTRLFAGLPRGTRVLVDGLAFGALPTSLLRAQGLRFVALVHHPLAAETGLSAAEATAFAASERAALAEAAGVICTSRFTAESLARDYGVAAARITVARPGTEPAARALGGNRPPCLLTVATLTPRKGHLILVAALAQIADLPWRAVFAGATDRDPATEAAVRARLSHYSLTSRVDIAGAVTAPARDALYAAADLFVLPSLHEGYGMAFAEAIARGLPVIGCRAGAVPEVVGTAGVLVPPGDTDALADALRRMITDPALRAARAADAWKLAATLPRWPDTAALVATALARA